MAEAFLCTTAELPAQGEAREFEVAGRIICIANADGELSAMDNVCAHRGGPLGQGLIENGKVVCPWHGWAFDPRTGAACHNAAFRVQVYPLHIEGQQVFIMLENSLSPTQE